MNKSANYPENNIERLTYLLELSVSNPLIISSWKIRMIKVKICFIKYPLILVLITILLGGSLYIAPSLLWIHFMNQTFTRNELQYKAYLGLLAILCSVMMIIMFCITLIFSKIWIKDLHRIWFPPWERNTTKDLVAIIFFSVFIILILFKFTSWLAYFSSENGKMIILNSLFSKNRIRLLLAHFLTEFFLLDNSYNLKISNKKSLESIKETEDITLFYNQCETLLIIMLLFILAKLIFFKTTKEVFKIGSCVLLIFNYFFIENLETHLAILVIVPCIYFILEFIQLMIFYLQCFDLNKVSCNRIIELLDPFLIVLCCAALFVCFVAILSKLNKLIFMAYTESSDLSIMIHSKMNEVIKEISLFCWIAFYAAVYVVGEYFLSLLTLPIDYEFLNAESPCDILRLELLPKREYLKYYYLNKPQSRSPFKVLWRLSKKGS